MWAVSGICSGTWQALHGVQGCSGRALSEATGCCRRCWKAWRQVTCPSACRTSAPSCAAAPAWRRPARRWTWAGSLTRSATWRRPSAAWECPARSQASAKPLCFSSGPAPSLPSPRPSCSRNAGFQSRSVRQGDYQIRGCHCNQEPAAPVKAGSCCRSIGRAYSASDRRTGAAGPAHNTAGGLQQEQQLQVRRHLEPPLPFA